MPDDWDADHKGSTVNSSLIELVVQSMKDAATYSSPLILDLDGDGIELVSLNSTYSVYFNIDSAKMMVWQRQQVGSRVVMEHFVLI